VQLLQYVFVSKFTLTQTHNIFFLLTLSLAYEFEPQHIIFILFRQY